MIAGTAGRERSWEGKKGASEFIVEPVQRLKNTPGDVFL
jgi:hypothetical protein